MSKSFEEQILSDVVKQVMTPEKIEAMAARLGPKIEKKMEENLMDALDNYLGDISFYDLFEDSDDLGNYFESLLRKSLGMPEKTKKSRR